jgi:EAL domain-containing protein (putative c-di-GMP-specific phosphodiesterase class I)
MATRVAVFSPEAREAQREAMRFEDDLRAALEADQFLLHFQAVVDLEARRAIGAEALIRWQHPELGLVPPGRFIPVAEKSGLIRPIGYWVLDAACARIAAWNAEGMPKQRIAINLAAEQFHDAGLVDSVRRAIDAHRISADQIELELTETAATTDHLHTRAVFSRLRDLGVSISIDDFGTGFASLSQLRRLPFDKLKIDREFVTEVHARTESQAICAALIALADGLGIDVLAEGTEEADEIRWLHGRGCRLFQGFGFARPMDADAYAAWIRSGELAAKSEAFGAKDAAAA